MSKKVKNKKEQKIGTKIKKRKSKINVLKNNIKKSSVVKKSKNRSNSNIKRKKGSTRRNTNKKRNITKIKVVGVGGCGGNIATRLYDSFPRGVEVIVINTDLQDLEHCRAHKKLYIGRQTTRGLGAGMDPELGRQSAEENREEIGQALDGADMIFITAGFGGGTGSGAAPIVAEIAKEMGILTVAVVTKPFSFEGVRRAQIAQDALEKLKDRADTFIVVSNEKIFSVINANTQISKAFSAIDDILKNAVIGVAETILNPGVVNVDFADVKYVMKHSGPAIIGVGVGSGKDRALNAANSAVKSPLLETSIDGSKGLLFSVSGRRDLKMNEINEIAKIVSGNVDDSARIVFGTYYDRRLNKGQVKVTIIATGFDELYKGGRTLFPEPDDIVEEIIDSNNSVSIFDEEKVEKPDDVVGDKNVNDTSENDEDVVKWDIPSFLRRKKKNDIT